MKFPNLLQLLLVLSLGFLLVPTVFASDSAVLNQNFTVWADITKDGVFYPATNATLTLINPNSTQVITDIQMDNYATGVFQYVYSFDAVGEWFGYVKYYNSTTLVAIASQSIIVREETSNMIPEQYIFIIIIAMLTFLAFYMGNYAIMIATGIFYFVAPFIFSFNWPLMGGMFEYLVFMLIGLAVIYQGISSLMHERKKSSDD